MFAFIKLYEISWLKWNKIDINLFITQFVIRVLYFPGSSKTDDPGKYKKVLSELIE